MIGRSEGAGKVGKQEKAPSVGARSALWFFGKTGGLVRWPWTALTVVTWTIIVKGFHIYGYCFPAWVGAEFQRRPWRTKGPSVLSVLGSCVWFLARPSGAQGTTPSWGLNLGLLGPLSHLPGPESDHQELLSLAEIRAGQRENDEEHPVEAKVQEPKGLEHALSLQGAQVWAAAPLGSQALSGRDSPGAARVWGYCSWVSVMSSSIYLEGQFFM